MMIFMVPGVTQMILSFPGITALFLDVSTYYTSGTVSCILSEDVVSHACVYKFPLSFVAAEIM